MPADGGRYGHNLGANETVQALLADAMDVRIARWSDTQRGATVTFDLHPDDIANNGGVHPFKGKDGKRFKLLLWEVADDETPLPPAAPASSRPRDAAPPGARSEQAKEAYRGKSEWQKAAAKAGMLCKDRDFQHWFANAYGRYCGYPDVGDINEAAISAGLRDLLGIKSRSEIGTDEGAFNRFLAIETDWKIHNGELPRPR